jgi:MFS family permease
MGKSPHYGFFIVITGILVAMAALGLGRFSLGMILPSMGKGLGLTYSEMGFVSTGNFIGYLLAVVACGRLYSRFGAKKLMCTGLSACALSMAAVSQAAGYWHVLFAYIVTGFGSGLANVTIMALVSTWFRKSHRGRAAGFIVSGLGLGLVFTGWLIPEINSLYGADGWRYNWLLLSVAVLVVALVAALFIKNNPADAGLLPLGEDPTASGGAASQPILFEPRRAVAILGLIYFFFGFSYAIYTTFLVTTLVKEVGLAEASAGRFWIWVGIFSIFSGPLFGSLSDRIGRKSGLAIVYSLQMVAYLLIGFQSTMYMVALSAFLFGITAWAIPSIMAAAVGDYMGPEKAALAFGTVTLVFGVGQVIGPATAGVLADISGGFSAGFLLAAAMALIAVFSTRLLPKTH